MTIGLLTNIVSPHQLPLAKAIADLIGPENYRYVYTEEFHAERTKMGWGCDVSGVAFKVCKLNDESRRWLESADLVYSEERDFNLFYRRKAGEKRTVYVSERWFRPPYGWLRLLSPKFFVMAFRMVNCLRSKSLYYFPQGVHAWRDMKRLCRLFGFWNCESQFRMWGYFVEKGIGNREQVIGKDGQPLRVLWVGRMLKLKRVDAIIRAVADVAKRRKQISCTIVGSGPEESRLKKLASSLQLQLESPTKSSPSPSTFTFLPSVPIAQVREFMRNHDVYVFPSDAGEGWGAVVSEALEEGMMVLGSYEAGASATILPPTHLFHAGDWRRLADLLQQVAAGNLQRITIGEWTAAAAAEKMVRMA